MKRFLKIILLVFTFFISLSYTFAIDAPVNFKLDSKTENSVSLSWDNVDSAYAYYVYFKKQSDAKMVSTDLVETNSLEVSSLQEWTTYEFVVVAFDSEWVESEYSSSIFVDIEKAAWAVDEIPFVFDKVEVVEYNKILLSFTNAIDNSDWAVREFKITNKVDELDSLEVIETSVDIQDSRKLLVTLDRDTEIGKEYEVVVVAISSVQGKNIESGIDSIQTFKVEEIVENTEATVTETPIVEEEEPELNSALREEPVWNNWTNLTEEEVKNNILYVSKNNSKLPVTWPEHVLILILTTILAALIFVFKYKKEDS